MVPNQYSLIWDSYKSSICGGFSSLQQNGEFVDMTLAADGHLVKVHQVLIALASPYLKELINSVPSQHPVIFLNNVPHATLGLLLEYIYTGEVLVPAKHLQSFMDAAKALHIRGLESVSSNHYPNKKVIQPMDINVGTSTNTKAKRGIPLDIQSVQTRYDLPSAARKISVRTEPQITNIITMKAEIQRPENEDHLYSETVIEEPCDNTSDDDHDQSMSVTTMSNDSLHHVTVKPDDDDDNRLADGIQDSRRIEAQDKVSSNNLQFTVSIRGSLQVILNRYMYNLHSTAHQSGLKRWRCIDYRNKKCPASLVTKGNVVLSRSCLHSHSFHDKKILTKIEKNAVYSALDEVVGYKEKERRKSVEEDWHMNPPGFGSLEYDSDPNDTLNSKSK